MADVVWEQIALRGVRPLCTKCGTPDVLWFVGDPCAHVKETPEEHEARRKRVEESRHG